MGMQCITLAAILDLMILGHLRHDLPAMEQGSHSSWLVLIQHGQRAQNGHLHSLQPA